MEDALIPNREKTEVTPQAPDVVSPAVKLVEGTPCSGILCCRIPGQSSRTRRTGKHWTPSAMAMLADPVAALIMNRISRNS